MNLDVLLLIQREAAREGLHPCRPLIMSTTRNVVRARWRVWAELNRLGATPTEIARAWGCDVTSVCHALNAPALPQDRRGDTQAAAPDVHGAEP